MTHEALLKAADAAILGGGHYGRFGVAVSGGSDSLGLLVALKGASKGKDDIYVATVDHGLRDGSADEAKYVAGFCEKAGIHHTTLKWEGWDGKGNLQDIARRTRYDLLARWAKANLLKRVFLGHTRNDQVETFLMRLGRGAGLDGLAGMRREITRHDVTFERPFLDIDREAIRAFLEDGNIKWIDDPSNDDDRFDRVKVRKAMVALEKAGIAAEQVARSAFNLAIASSSIANEVYRAARVLVREDSGDLLIKREGFRNLTLEVQRRLASRTVMYVSSDEYPPRSEPLSRVISTMKLGKGDARTLHGCIIECQPSEIRVSREYDAVSDLKGPTDQPWDARWTLKGPHRPDLEVRALGEAVSETPWRDTGLPRQSLISSPAVWRGDVLVAAPVAGLRNGWFAKATGRGKFADFLISR